MRSRPSLGRRAKSCGDRWPSERHVRCRFGFSPLWKSVDHPIPNWIKRDESKYGFPKRGGGAKTARISALEVNATRRRRVSPLTDRRASKPASRIRPPFHDEFLALTHVLGEVKDISARRVLACRTSNCGSIAGHVPPSSNRFAK